MIFKPCFYGVELNLQGDNHRQFFDQFKQTINDSNRGFFKFVENSQRIVDDCQKLYEKHKSKKHFVHVGIGGSSLGPEMLLQALGKRTGVAFHFINNIDPDAIHYELEKIDLKSCLFYIVSKSGGTAETMANFILITNYLSENGIDKDDFKEYFVFATDPEKSELRDLGLELNIPLLSIPTNVGGRFSVLTAVGCFPALFANINFNNVLEGANSVKDDLLRENIQENVLTTVAAFLYTLKKERGVNQTVFMPYSSQLKNLSFWFTQLWSESLGKRYSLNKEEIFDGLTPIPAYGATDQHSQMQLFMEGPNDKCIILVEIDKFSYDFKLNNSFSLKSSAKLSNFSLTQLIKAELYGTIKALKENRRPFIHLHLSKIDEYNMGGFILFLESLTVLMGHYLNVNPFDQPGVEAGKKYAFEFLAGDAAD